MSRLADKIVSGDMSSHEVVAEVVRMVVFMISTKQVKAEATHQYVSLTRP